MGIFGALTSAVGGMQAQSYALQNISGNIANSQTTAYKRTDTSFADMIQDAQPSKQVSGSVSASSRATNTVQGDLQTASIGTFMAINGSGFFVVQKPTGLTDNTPQFSGVSQYTRRGDFQPDKDGYLVNGSGYYLMGIGIDPTSGNPSGSVPAIIRINNDFQQAQATTRIQYRANLAADPVTPSGKAVLAQETFAKNPVYGASTLAKAMSSGGNLKPDAPATVTGTINNLVGGTTLASLGVNVGDTLTVNDGTSTTTYTAAAGETVADLVTAIGGGAAAVSCAIVDGKVQIVSDNAVDTLTVGGNNAGNAALRLGLSTAPEAPTNLLTQGIDPNTQLVITVRNVSTGAVTGALPITFGTGAGKVATIAQLQAAISGAGGVGTIGLTGAVAASGAMTLTATNSGQQIDIADGTNKLGFYTNHAYPADGTVAAADADNFLSQSLGGGAITTYDVSGRPINVQLRWAKVSSAETGGADTWNLFYQLDGSSPWTNAGRDFAFDAKGELTTATPLVTINGSSFDFGVDGITQYADTNGSVSVNLIQQNGYPAGKLQTVSVSEKGRLVGAFSNGRTVDLYEITLANFNGANFLKKLDGGAFAVTDESGSPIYNAAGAVIGNSLESSNTDIADEFTKLIVTQQAYSANTRVITTTNTMVQDLLNMLR